MCKYTKISEVDPNLGEMRFICYEAGEDGGIDRIAAFDRIRGFWAWDDVAVAGIEYRSEGLAPKPGDDFGDERLRLTVITREEFDTLFELAIKNGMGPLRGDFGLFWI